MKHIAIAAVALLVTLGTAAAQSSGAATGATSASPGTTPGGALGSTAATPGTNSLGTALPSGSTVGSAGLGTGDALTDKDKAVDRRIKSICKGC